MSFNLWRYIECWDAESARLSQSFDTPKAVAAVAVKAGGGRVAWCGGGDRLVHMWDPRAGQTTGATTSFASHTVRFSIIIFFVFFPRAVLSRLYV